MVTYIIASKAKNPFLAEVFTIWNIYSI